MAITQERMMAILFEMEKLKTQISDIYDYAAATADIGLTQLAKPIDTPVFWLEKGHFDRVARANMRRTLKLRDQRDSLTTRPLLALRPKEDLIAQVTNKQLPNKTELAIEKALIETPQTSSDYETLYNQMREEHPEWDAVKLLAECKRRQERDKPITGSIF